MSGKKAAVLLSGGLDSATCLGMAVNVYGRDSVLAMTVSYGQKHEKETKCASDLAKHYGVSIEEVNLARIFSGSKSTLIDRANEVPEGTYESQTRSMGVSTYVPYRNGLMVSALASRVLSIDQDAEWVLYIGVHSDDAAGDAYPDCSEEFIDHLGKAISIGTYGKVSVCAPFVGLHKRDVVAKGLELGVPYELTWSCYKGGDKQCGRCGTCIDRKEAFRLNGAVDPVPYE